MEAGFRLRPSLLVPGSVRHAGDYPHLLRSRWHWLNKSPIRSRFGVAAILNSGPALLEFLRRKDLNA